MFTVIGGIALILGGDGIAIEPEGTTKNRTSIKDQITLIPLRKGPGLYIFPGKFEVRFKEKGKKTGVVVFECDKDHFFSDITIKRGDSSVSKIPDVPTCFISEVGTVDLAGKGNEHVFFVTESGGTGGRSINLNLINPGKGEVVGLSMWFSFKATEATTQVSATDNFYSKDFQRERRFLEEIKYEYGFMGEEEINKEINNPDFAYYFWAKDNSGIEDGKMRIRKYRGKHQCMASITDELREGNIVYTAYFKAGVIAYDENTDEHFILFHPNDMYSWPTLLKKTGPYLLIGTRGEGLAMVNLETFHLKRFRFLPPNHVISELELLDSTIRINATKEIDLPSF